MTTADMFTLTDTPTQANTPASGLLVTNHLNLMYMLAAGLVMPPAGFGGKYYQDTLACFPGWIPLFIGNAPREAIDSSTAEAGHLKPCIVEIDLSNLSGKVTAFGEDGFKELHFPGQLGGGERLILVPAPVPVSWIESITFQSVKDKRACEADAKDLSNVPFDDFVLKAKKPLFTKAPNTPWPPNDGPAERTVPLEAPLAAGGVMAMLLLFGNLGEQAVRSCQSAFDPDDYPASPADDHPILAGLGTWVREGVASPPALADSEADRTSLQKSFQAKLFWEALEQLVRWRDADRAKSAEDVLIDHLSRASSASNLDPRLQSGIRKLQDTLESLTGFADGTASELLERHDTPLAHAMTLFFLRRDCTDLFDFSSDRLSEPDWLATAILFGVRDGWLNLPLRLRAHPGLSEAVSHRMARLAHRIAGTGLDLGAPPGRIRPLRELFGDGSTWRSVELSAAVELARVQKWGCIHTRISLGAGEYKLTVKGGSLQIDIAGEPRIAPDIDRERFFDLLSRTRADHKTETNIRKKLRS